MRGWTGLMKRFERQLAKHVVLADGDRVPIIYNDIPYQIGASSPSL